MYLNTIISRLLQAAWVIVAVSAIAFALFQYVGDPVSQMLGQDASAADRDALRRDLGLDRPVALQFLQFLGNAARGDFGLSLQQGRPVMDLILERLPATLELTVFSTAIAVLLGVPMGMVAALRPRALVSRAIMLVSLIGGRCPPSSSASC